MPPRSKKRALVQEVHWRHLRVSVRSVEWRDHGPWPVRRLQPNDWSTRCPQRRWRFLYSINFATDGSIAAFSIEVDGSLARVPGAPFVTTEPTRWLVTDPAADFLFAIAYSGDLTVYAIDSSTGG